MEDKNKTEGRKVEFIKPGDAEHSFLIEAILRQSRKKCKSKEDRYTNIRNLMIVNNKQGTELLIDYYKKESDVELKDEIIESLSHHHENSYTAEFLTNLLEKYKNTKGRIGINHLQNIIKAISLIGCMNERIAHLLVDLLNHRNEKVAIRSIEALTDLYRTPKALPKWLKEHFERLADTYYEFALFENEEEEKTLSKKSKRERYISLVAKSFLEGEKGVIDEYRSMRRIFSGF